MTNYQSLINQDVIISFFCPSQALGSKRGILNQANDETITVGLTIYNQKMLISIEKAPTHEELKEIQNRILRRSINARQRTEEHQGTV